MTAVDLTSAQPGVVHAPARAPRARASDWLRELSHVSDALLHPRRRRAAYIQLRNLRPRSILFVCQGNICRSPFAAAAFAGSYAINGTRAVTAASAGFIGPGRTPPAKALSAALRHGINISAHRSEMITPERLQTADLVVVMSAEQARAIRGHSGSTRVLVLGDLDPDPTTRRTIADPWGGTDHAFDASYERIDRCVRELARILREVD